VKNNNGKKSDSKSNNPTLAQLNAENFKNPKIPKIPIVIAPAVNRCASRSIALECFNPFLTKIKDYPIITVIKISPIYARFGLDISII